MWRCEVTPPRKELEVRPARKAGNLLREKRKTQQSWGKQAFFQIRCRPSLGGALFPAQVPRGLAGVFTWPG